jgi:hypothetical protein
VGNASRVIGIQPLPLFAERVQRGEGRVRVRAACERIAIHPAQQGVWRQPAKQQIAADIARQRVYLVSADENVAASAADGVWKLAMPPPTFVAWPLARFT